MNRRFPRTDQGMRTCILTLICFMLMPVGLARAGIVECRPVGNGYSVFLSEPAVTPAAFGNSRDEMLGFLRRLYFELDQTRDRGWISSPSADVRFVLCEKRSPALDGHEFDPTLVESLYNGRVLLEIWGDLDAARPAGQPAAVSAKMNYLLVPVKFAASLNEPVPDAMPRLEYPEQGAQPVDDFVQLIARPIDIDSFVAVALGFKLLRERKYDLAHQNLCRGSALLQSIERRPLGARSRSGLEALRVFVQTCASRAIREAGADTRYAATGILRLQDPNQPCAVEE